jgi:peroxiredoxin
MFKDVHAKRRFNVGDNVARRALAAVSGEPIGIPDSHRLVHLQFRRFAGCPVCNLHLQSFSRRHREIAAAGIREVIVFHSKADDLRPYTADLPFAVIADPGKRLYLEFGVESSPRALLDPRAWPSILRGIIHSFVSIVRDKQPVPSLTPHGGRFGLPADFLIAPDGRVLARKYGNHADDHWSVDGVLTLAREAAPSNEPLRIDPRALNGLEFRIDAFSVPAGSRDIFEALMRRNVAFIETLPGFLHHIVFEKTQGTTLYDIVTIAVWSGPEAIATAREKVRAYYRTIGFDMATEFAKLGITASLGYYRAPVELQ